MKRLITPIFVSCLLAACGSNNGHNSTKQENQNYPTYDTAQKPDRINDSVSDGGMRSGGNLRNGRDEEPESH